MNLRKRLEHIAHMLGSARRYGKTTVTAKACKELDGVLLCASHEHATRVKREHGVTTASIDKELNGIRGPFFIDHYALERLLHRASNKIKELEHQNTTLQMQKTNLEYEVMDLMRKVED